MKGRDALRELLANKTTDGTETPPPPRRSSGAIRAMSLDLQHLSDQAASAKALKETLENSEPIIELQPEDIDPSPIADRIPINNDPAYDELKAAIAENGQQVPILVRSNPEQPGRYQIAYGRRRLKVAKDLGRNVKAIVRSLSDNDLIIAQAQENGNRVDLSFIERSLFASNLLNHGFEKETIALALNVDKPELSRFLTIADAVTPLLIKAIGPAPKVGRPRWLLLTKSLGQPGALARATQATETIEFTHAETNKRFNIVLAAANNAAVDGQAQKSAINTKSGQRVGWVERTKKGIRLSSNIPGFAAFLESRLPSLLDEYAIDQSNETKGDQ
jgi:ParB family chromosome partitioning protein